MPLEVEQIRNALLREFEHRISLEDYETRTDEERTIALLSRALAAKSACVLTDCTTEEAVGGIIDGRDDFGIDAIAFSGTGTEIWLVQAKWSNRARAGFDTAAAHKLVHGLKKLDNREFSQFNSRLQLLADRVHGVMKFPTCKIYLVAALMGRGDISDEVKDILNDASRDFGGFGRTVQYRVLGQADFHRAIRDDLAPEAITITAKMVDGWHSRDTPYRAYAGLVSVDELARWYEYHGERLYDRNVRRSLGLTGVNQALVRSMLEDPQGFWYRHNGITVQCDKIDPEFFARRGQGEPVKLTLHNASVVNGAQTVTSAHKASRETGDALSDAYVTVRIISIEDASEGFAKEITKATNTQNRMERRDFVSIDEMQSRIWEDFQLSLGKEYVFKRGEIDPAPASGCSVTEAATALACAHPDPLLAVRVNGSADSLWEEGPSGAYTRLFEMQPSAYQIWRCVQVMREIRDVLYRLRSSMSGRAYSIADSGTYLIAHLVFQRLGTEGIEESDSDWESGVDVDSQVEAVLSQLIPLVDRMFGAGSYVTSTFANEQRCAQLATGVLQALSAGVEISDLSSFKDLNIPKPIRRPNTVSLLVDHDSISVGTRLVYQPNQKEAEAIGPWLDEDPRRRVATWFNDRKKPLLWQADGERYSPSGLVTYMWKLAEWREAWVAVQGPKQWEVPNEGTLVEIAERVWRRLMSD